MNDHTNAVLVSLTAIPVFFWAKRMMQPRFALLAAVLTLAMPSMACVMPTETNAKRAIARRISSNAKP
jgi:hypothetical protein